jgi:hypothetical protein
MNPSETQSETAKTDAVFLRLAEAMRKWRQGLIFDSDLEIELNVARETARQLERELTALKPTELTGRRDVENIESKPFPYDHENGPELPVDAKAKKPPLTFTPR